MTDGTFGTAVTMVQAVKVFTLCMILAFGTWISAYTIGQSAGELVGFYDQYSDDTNKEGTDKETGKRDPRGTAFAEDILYQTITAAYSYVVLSAMMVGGYWFFMNFNAYTVGLGDCDLDNVSLGTYSNIKSLVPTLRDMTYAECQTALKNAYSTVDINGDGVVSQCEDAKFLLGMGNTKEYAQTYPGSYSQSSVIAMCDYIVPDGFAQKETIKVDFLAEIMNMWPFSLFTDGMNMKM